ncbi:cilia- and flagella-associated protein 52 [Phthorimaea operculella]|nr:cilia- and flagella-associated protein 52 [Phthorimaea operculella]
MLEASKSGAINGVHVSSDGSLFVTGGNDQMVKLWRYQEGIYTHMGLGHAGAVTSCKFSHNMRYVVSACAAGTIIVWRVPEEYVPKQESQQSLGGQIKPGLKKKKQSLQDELKLPLEKPQGAGDRKLPAAPNKTEKIDAIDTTRSSVHSCCPCEPSARSRTSDAKNISKPSPKTKCCAPPDNLPTKTTSKETVRGGGDRK